MRAFILSLLATLLLQVESAGAAPSLPVLSAITGKEIARSYRLDGAPPSREVAERDKKACLQDPKAVSDKDADKLWALGQKNRTAAEVEVLKAINSCMTNKGWHTVIIAGER